MAEKEEKTELLKFEEFSNLYNKKIETEKKLKDAEKELADFKSQTANEYAKWKAGKEPERPMPVNISFPWLLILFGLILAVLAVGTIATIIWIIVSFAKGNVEGITLGVQLCFICIPIIIFAIIASIKWIIPNFNFELEYFCKDIREKKSYPKRLQNYEKACEKYKKQIEFFKKEYPKIKTKLSEKVKNTKQELLDINKELQAYTAYLEVFDATVEDAEIKNSKSLVNVKEKVLSYWNMENFYRHIQDDKFINHYKNLFKKWDEEKYSDKKQDLWCDDAVKELIITYLKSSNTFTFSSTIEKIVSVLLFTIDKEEERLEEERKANEKKAEEWKLCWNCQSYKDGGGHCILAPRKECSTFRMAKEEDYSICKNCINRMNRYGDRCSMTPEGGVCPAFRLKQR